MASTTFKIGFDVAESPSVAFLFNLVEKAAYDFAEIFQSRKRQINLFNHKIERPVLKKYEIVFKALLISGTNRQNT